MASLLCSCNLCEPKVDNLDPADYVTHLRVNHSATTFACSQCSLEFSGADEEAEHAKGHPNLAAGGSLVLSISHLAQYLYTL